MKILIADDDEFSRALLAQALEGMGHEVCAVAEGYAAWQAVRREYYPVLITDWMMPRINGLELCRMIRTVSRDQYTFIVMLTVLGGKESYLEAMEAGADDFLNKPLDVDQLAARIHVAERILGLRRHVRNLEGLLPICAYCKRIRTEQREWQEVEHYVAEHSTAHFSHGICPQCMAREFPDVLPRRDQRGSGPSG